MTRYTELCFVCVGVGNTELCLLVVLDWVTLLPSEILLTVRACPWGGQGVRERQCCGSDTYEAFRAYYLLCTLL